MSVQLVMKQAWQSTGNSAEGFQGRPKGKNRTRTQDWARFRGVQKGPEGHLETTWRPLGVQDAPEVQQKSSKGVQKAKIEPERESGHDFEGAQKGQQTPQLAGLGEDPKHPGRTLEYIYIYIYIYIYVIFDVRRCKFLFS